MPLKGFRIFLWICVVHALLVHILGTSINSKLTFNSLTNYSNQDDFNTATQPLFKHSARNALRNSALPDFISVSASLASSHSVPLLLHLIQCLSCFISFSASLASSHSVPLLLYLLILLFRSIWTQICMGKNIYGQFQHKYIRTQIFSKFQKSNSEKQIFWTNWKLIHFVH